MPPSIFKKRQNLPVYSVSHAAQWNCKIVRFMCVLIDTCFPLYLWILNPCLVGFPRLSKVCIWMYVSSMDLFWLQAIQFITNFFTWIIGFLNSALIIYIYFFFKTFDISFKAFQFLFFFFSTSFSNSPFLCLPKDSSLFSCSPNLFLLSLNTQVNWEYIPYVF